MSILDDEDDIHHPVIPLTPHELRQLFAKIDHLEARTAELRRERDAARLWARRWKRAAKLYRNRETDKADAIAALNATCREIECELLRERDEARAWARRLWQAYSKPIRLTIADSDSCVHNPEAPLCDRCGRHHFGRCDA